MVVLSHLWLWKGPTFLTWTVHTSDILTSEIVSRGMQYLFELFRQRAVEVSENGEVRLVEEGWLI